MDSLQKVPGLFRFQSCPAELSWLIRGDMVPLQGEFFMDKFATHMKSINIFPVLLITSVRAGSDRPSTRERQVGRYDVTRRTSLKD